jgi:hypothetical protein
LTREWKEVVRLSGLEHEMTRCCEVVQNGAQAARPETETSGLRRLLHVTCRFLPEAHSRWECQSEHSTSQIGFLCHTLPRVIKFRLPWGSVDPSNL